MASLDLNVAGTRGLSAVQPGSAAVMSGNVRKGDYAKHRGVSPAYISKLIREGKLTAPALQPDGRVNIALADLQLAGMADPARSAMADPSRGEMVGEMADITVANEPGSFGGSAAPASFADARTRKMLADAEAAEIALARTRGEVVDRASVADAFQEIGSTVRGAMDVRRRELAAALLGITDMELMLTRLAESDRALCQTLAESAQSTAGELLNEQR